MKNEGKQGRQIAGILLSALACGMILYSLYLCLGSDIWYDELLRRALSASLWGV